MTDLYLYDPFWKLCRQSNLSMEEVNEYLTKYTNSSSLAATMVHIEDIVTRHTNKMESLKEHKTNIRRMIEQAENVKNMDKSRLAIKYREEYLQGTSSFENILAEEQRLQIQLRDLDMEREIKLKVKTYATEKLYLNMLAEKDLKGVYDMKKPSQKEMEAGKKLKEKAYDTEKLNQDMLTQKKLKGANKKLNQDMLTQKKLKGANKKLKGAYDMKKLSQVEMETEKKLKEKPYDTEILDQDVLAKIRAQDEVKFLQEKRKLKEAYDMKKLSQEEMETEKKPSQEEMETEKKLKEKMQRKMGKKMKGMEAVREQLEKDFRENYIKYREVGVKIIEYAHLSKPVSREFIKEAEIIREIKNMIEAEYLEGMVAEIATKEFSELLHIEKVKESEENNTLTMAACSTSRTKHFKTGTVSRAACKLFNASIERCNFNIGKQQALIVSCDKEYGDYACGNVLRIWPKLKEMGTKLQGPKDVGTVIKRNLPQSDMIEGTPSLHSFGILSFKISGKWMAKRIHRMLIEGIETWAPEVSLERAIVDHPSLDIVEGSHMDMLRRRYISRSLICMLEYLQVDVLNSAHEASHMDLAANVIKIEERDGEVMIYNKAEGEPKLLLKGKSDRGLSDAFKDLGHLWYVVEKLNAQRLLYVTHVAKQEYIEMCFTAAKGAGWLSSAPLEPPFATYVGYRSCTTKFEKLRYMLKAKAIPKVIAFVSRGNAANYTGRDILESCIQYTLLKTHRMADCTLDIDEMLDEEGNTFLYLLKTRARIHSITNICRKDIRELIKKASVFIPEKDDLLEKGVERELGFHILDLTEVLRESCFPVLPHNLCKYLYNLSEIFNRYFVSTFAQGRRSLLLCEATAVVMEKCFHLLDITPQSYKNELGVTRMMYGAQLPVERPINVKEVEDANAPHVGRDPPKIQNPRFEPFSISVCVDPDFEADIMPVKLFGFIDVADTCGLRSDGWTSTQRPDISYVDLFRRPWSDPIDMVTGGCLGFGDPSCSRSVPFSSSMGVAMNLVATNKDKNDFVTICNMEHNLDFSGFLASKLDGFCGNFTVGSEGGQVKMNYILLRDAVDATFEVTFRTSLQNINACGSINAYYEDGFPGECDTFTKTFYTAPLFELNSPSILKGGPIQLRKSRMAVPRKGSLKVMAHLQDVQVGKPWKRILSDFCYFPSQTNGSNIKYLKGTNCSFEVKINWSYCQ